MLSKITIFLALAILTNADVSPFAYTDTNLCGASFDRFSGNTFGKYLILVKACDLNNTAGGFEYRAYSFGPSQSGGGPVMINNLVIGSYPNTNWTFQQIYKLTESQGIVHVYNYDDPTPVGDFLEFFVDATGKITLSRTLTKDLPLISDSTFSVNEKSQLAFFVDYVGGNMYQMSIDPRHPLQLTQAGNIMFADYGILVNAESGTSKNPYGVSIHRNVTTYDWNSRVLARTLSSVQNHSEGYWAFRQGDLAMILYEEAGTVRDSKHCMRSNKNDPNMGQMYNTVTGTWGTRVTLSDTMYMPSVVTRDNCLYLLPCNGETAYQFLLPKTLNGVSKMLAAVSPVDFSAVYPADGLLYASAGSGLLAVAKATC